MTKIILHIPEPLEGLPLAPGFGAPKIDVFGAPVRNTFFENEVQKGALSEACAIVMPNNFTRSDAGIRAYITRHAEEAERRGIPLFLFSFGDFTDRLAFDPRAYVFRLSLYRSAARLRDIIVPTLTEDLGRKGILIRSKAEIPTVSFCGQAGYRTMLQWMKYYVKILMHLFDPARRLGVHWRRRMIAACRRSALVQTLFIIRRSFSGVRSTIELDPARARAEFFQSIVDADFVLAPKGDGNYSNRFLEALSLGRIPVIVDTDIALPLEGVIDYSPLCIRVPMDRVSETPQYIREFYDALTEQEWERKQRFAREVFEKYLRQDSFFRYFFSHTLPMP